MHPILKAFIPTANLIQKSSPFACEVVLHDLSNPQRSVDASVAKSLFEMAGNFLKTSENEPKSEQNDDVMQIVLNLIDKIIAKNEGKKLKKEQKLELVGFMNEKGIFNIKGAIEVVAAKLNVSKITIYGYLDQLKKKRP